MPKRESCGSVLPCGWPPLDPMPSTAPTCNPHRACGTAGCPTPPRLRALALLGRRPHQRVEDHVMPASEKPTQEATFCAAETQRAFLPSDRREVGHRPANWDVIFFP